ESALSFDLVTGTERKTTGSYYIGSERVQELIKSALVPVIEDRLRAVEDNHKDIKESGLRDPRALVVQQKENAILAIKVCDPACGSGHFLLAAARRLGRELARVRSGEDQPTPAIFRRAVRDVIQHCIYGVDLNPLAVDLCKLALWIEGHNAGMPLSFLDHHIKQGNSLIGATRALVAQGIPDDAYKPVTGDDRKVASEIRKRNKAERDRYKQGAEQHSLFDAPANDGGAALAEALRQLDEMSAGTVAEVRAKAGRYRQLRAEAEAEFTHFNLWVSAFFQPLTPANAQRIPTTTTLADFERNPRTVRADVVGAANGLAAEVGFFHWELEFPQVFDREMNHEDTKGTKGDDLRALRAFVVKPEEIHHEDTKGTKNDDLRAFVVDSGFDVVLGNPPWERIKLQEQEHFVDVPEIARAANKSAREKMIAEWRSGSTHQRSRIAEFDAARYRAEAESRFVRASGRFPLTAVGDVNTYALFAEHFRSTIAPKGRAGVIVPTGIATDDSTKAFFGALSNGQLISLFDIENREAIFPGVHRSYKFSLLTIGTTNQPAQLLFFATNTAQLAEPQRRFSLTPEEIALINPNTRTAPVFRTSADAELTKKIYRRVPVLVNENHEGTKGDNLRALRASVVQPEEIHHEDTKDTKGDDDP
ncbi:MAG TPA: N-6 DNA methylase, partial [Roseiflexaceae bacterium]|nr:N-6 DNA methylase [Roseiflexaceae bacterium]